MPSTKDNKDKDNVPPSQDSCNSPLPEMTIAGALDLAFSCYQDADMPKTEQLCRLILAKVPDLVDAMQLLGLVLTHKGQYAESLGLFQQAVIQSPGHWSLHNNLGITLHRMGRYQDAISQFHRAIELRPDFAKGHSNLGGSLIEIDRWDEAVAACTQAIRLDRDFKQAHNNLALALKGKGNLDQAVAAYKKAVDIDPHYAEAMSNLGMALIDQGKLDQADEYLQKVVTLAPDSAKFLNNLGILFNRQGHFEQAVTASEKAIAMSEDYLEAYNNLGTALMELGQFSRAQTAFEKAIAIDSECAQPHHNLSLILLLRGHFAQGWEEYQWRWRHNGFHTPLRPFDHAWWNGSVDDVGKLLVWGEQGIGDEIQFSGLIRDITKRGISVVIECDGRLTRLLQRSFPDIPVVHRSNPPAEMLKNIAITHQIPVCSIPYALFCGQDGMASVGSYLVYDKHLRDKFRTRYRADRKPLLVGISFKSGNSQEGKKRSIALEHWSPILKTAGIRFVNLQYGACSNQLQKSFEQTGVETLEDDQIDPITDPDSFAAQVAAMDLVISVDNSTVHFAGALGVKVWTMLPAVPDWRWGLESDQTTWYPTMRLFRQTERGDWKAVISKVAEALASFVELSNVR